MGSYREPPATESRGRSLRQAGTRCVKSEDSERRRRKKGEGATLLQGRGQMKWKGRTT